MRVLLKLLLITQLLSCGDMRNDIKWHGHRGCKGLMPENTIMAFIHALKFPIHAIEMDIVITKDKLVLVSHEPYMSSEICLDKDGTPIENGLLYNIYQMNLEEVQKYDCGSLKLPNFPDQKNMKAIKPTLSEVVEAVEKESARLEKTIIYNIEIKSKEGYEDVFHPAPNEYAKLVYNEIDKLQIKDRVIIQSFDFRVLQALNKLDSKISLAMLVDNELTPNQNLRNLAFTPDYYSPKYKLVDETTKDFCIQNGMKLIVWTVNDISGMNEMIELGVDEIITDYPNLIENVVY